MNPKIEAVKQLAQARFAQVKDIRRHLHRHPELSFQEHQTAAFVESELQKLGLRAQRMATTGVIAHIEGQEPECKLVALRADLDALPIQEQNERDYVSRNKGVMHACGHDVHTSCLLGAAFVLNELKENFKGTVRLIFQPGEEKLPGGASLLIEEGVLENPVPSAIIGQHVMPELRTGKAGFRPGLYMASADEIYVTVKGKGGHGAMPHRAVDPVLISAHLLVALQQVVSRWSDPKMPSVLSFGRVLAEGATNVIPGEVRMEGTFRTFDESWREEAHRRMKDMAKGLVESMGGTVDFDIYRGYPSLKNQEALTLQLQEAAEGFLGKEQVEPLEMRPTAEDFAFYTHHVPACFYRLGTGNVEKGITASVHHPQFDIDEDALLTGTGLMAWLALTVLKG